MGKTVADMIVVNYICIISSRLLIEHWLDYEPIAAALYRCINIQTNYDSSELFYLADSSRQLIFT